jgi:uncharacterized protein (TIGR03435 family)
MTDRPTRNCGFARGLFFVATCSAFFASGQTQLPAVRPEFEVASVKPNASGSNNLLMRPPVDGRFTATNVTLKMLIALAYKVRQLEISGGPTWIASDRYDVNAKAADSNVSADQSRLMIQKMLEDRFRLMVHRETKEMPVYALLPAKNGLKIRDSKEGECVAVASISPRASTPDQPFTPVCGSFIVMPTGLDGKDISMAQLANSLSGIVGPPVIDKTGYAAGFDFHLEFTRDVTATQPNFPPAAGDKGLAATPGDTSGPSIFAALQEQLGLKLEATKGPVEVIVIDHAEKASVN